MTIKKFLALLLCFAVVFSTFSLQSSAITPRWSNTFCVEIIHDSVDGYACCYVAIDAYDGTNKIDNVNIKLYRVIGTTLTLVAHWDDLSASGDYFEFYDEILGVPTGYTYRLAFTADVHRYGTVESLDQYNDMYYD